MNAWCRDNQCEDIGANSEMIHPTAVIMVVPKALLRCQLVGMYRFRT